MMHRVIENIIVALALILVGLIMSPLLVNSAGREYDVGVLGWDRANPRDSVKAFINTNHGLEVQAISTDYPHHKIHTCGHYVTSKAATLASGAKRHYLINATNTDDVTHMIISSKGSGKLNWTLHEGGAVSAGSVGATLTPQNRRRDCATLTDSTTKITNGASPTSFGNTIYNEVVGAGQNVSGETRSMHEFVLKRNTYYIVNVTSEAANNAVWTEFDYYLSDDAY